MEADKRYDSSARGFSAPAGTPEEIVDILSGAMKKPWRRKRKKTPGGDWPDSPTHGFRRFHQVLERSRSAARETSALYRGFEKMVWMLTEK
jgi:hypothetical protein